MAAVTPMPSGNPNNQLKVSVSQLRMIDNQLPLTPRNDFYNFNSGPGTLNAVNTKTINSSNVSEASSPK